MSNDRDTRRPATRRRRNLTQEEIRQIKKARARKQQMLRARRNRALILLAAIGLLLILAIAGITSMIRKSIEKKKQLSAVTETETQTTSIENTVENSSGEDIKLIMVGDILLHDTLEKYAEVGDGSYDYKSIFSEIQKDVKAADLALENQEVIIGGADLGVSGYPSFNAPFDLADDIADAGFNVILQATNHALDKGMPAVKNCLEYWRTHYPDIAVLGMHESEIDAEKIYVYEQNDIRVAILNYTQISNKTVDKNVQSYTLDSMTKEKVHEDVERAKEMADFVVVCPHWGTEYTLQADAKQKDMAQFLLKEGVDLVIGTHPHVIQPIEMLEDPDTGHKMLVYYSIGNLTSWVLKESENIGHRVTSGMAQVVIGRRDDGSVGIKDYGINPLICHYTESLDSVVVYPLDQYTDEMARSHLVNTYTGNFDCNYLEKHFSSVWGDYRTLKLQ